MALPDIGQALNASNQQLTFITDAYQIAIASTVLYLGAVGDRYGRKKLLLLGAALCIPFSIPSAMAHGWQGLVTAQMATGVGGGMIYPTTLPLITALYSGKTMMRAVADQLVAAARDAFTQGKTLAISFALGAALIGVALVLWKYPRHQAEQEELSAIAAKNEEYLAKLDAPSPASPSPAPSPVRPGTV